MKKLFFIFILTSFIFPKRIVCQWERIGWQGGSVTIAAQLGKTFIGIAESIYRSDDEGHTWYLFTEGIPKGTFNFIGNGDSLYSDGISIHCRIPDYYQDSLYYQYHGEYVMKESDTSWTFLPDPLIDSLFPVQLLHFGNDSLLAFITDTLYGYEFHSKVHASTDKGKSWIERPTIIPDSMLLWYEEITQVGNRVIMEPLLRISGPEPYKDIIFSDDLGATWHRMEGLPVGRSVHFVSASDKALFAYQYSSNKDSVLAELYHSTDKGTTWYPLSKDLNISNGWSLGFVKSIFDTLYLSMNSDRNANNYFYTSTDNGSSWSLILPTPYINSMYRISDGYIVNNNYFYNNNLGFKSKLSFQGCMSDNMSLVYVNNTTLIARTLFDDYYYDFSADTIYVSSDNGESWTSREFFQKNRLFTRWFNDDTMLYAGGMTRAANRACLFRSFDHGDTWEMFFVFDSIYGFVKDIIARKDTFIIVLDEYEIGDRYFASIDNGKSWVEFGVPGGLTGFMPDPPPPTFTMHNGLLFTSFENNYTDYSISSDLGTTWESKIAPYGSAYGGDFYCVDLNGTDLYGFISKKVDSTLSKCPIKAHNYRSSDNGETWIANDKDFSDVQRLISVVSSDKIFYGLETRNSEYAPDQDGSTNVYISEDQGKNWRKLFNPIYDVNNIFIGSKYIFAAGSTLWRVPNPHVVASVNNRISPASIILGDCQPNPAATYTTITYSIPSRSDVRLIVSDMTGKEVAELVNIEELSGTYKVHWNTKAIPSGAYILRLNAKGESVVKRIHVLK